MQLIYKNLPSRRTEDYLITVGVFDGVHLGHQYLLNKLKSESAEKGKPSLVISFDFPPEKILLPAEKFTGYITDYRQKASLIKAAGIDCFWVLRAEKSLLRFSPSEFLSYINNYFAIDSFIAGRDFRFGIKAQAGINELISLSSDYGFKLKIIDKKKYGRSFISSSLIKELIRTANFEKARKLLGRDFSLKGKVKKGRGVGRRLGFPTANLNTYEYVLPAQGVYSAYARIGKENFLAAVNINREAFEVHLINFSRNILNSCIEVFFLEKIRDELNLQSHCQLKRKIQKDIQLITSKYSAPPV